MWGLLFSNDALARFWGLGFRALGFLKGSFYKGSLKGSIGV